MKKRMLIASTSTVYGGTYLEYLRNELSNFLQGVNEVLFIPYAQPGGISYDQYTSKVQQFFNSLNINIIGIHTQENPKQAIEQSEAIFVGGGNTFLLVSTLYRLQIMNNLKQAVENGTRYIGTSAGSNITGVSMQTTNDMPIVFTPSFETLSLVPFNINPHYLDPEKVSHHMGETRETRILEFHKLNNTPVVGLREGSWLIVENQEVTLKGTLSARIFEQGEEPYEIYPKSVIKFKK